MSKTYIPASLRQLVFDRANGLCEYCLFPEALSAGVHQVDHMIAEKHRGPTDESNLVLSCSTCNYAKGSDIASIDPNTNQVIRLYRPRQDSWADHFKIEPESGLIQPLTAIGRVTVYLLRLNDEKRVVERMLWIHSGAMAIPKGANIS
jgi:HNH endonuclease